MSGRHVLAVAFWLLVAVPVAAHAQVPAYSAFFRADLTGSQMVPPNTSSAKGFLSLAVQASGTAVSFQIMAGTFSIAGGPVHIHGPAGPGGVGPIIVAPPGCSAAIQITCSAAFTITPTQLSHLRSGLWYVDVHSPVSTEEIRGHILPDAPFRANHSVAQVVGSPPPSAAGGYSWFTLSADLARMAQWHNVSGYGSIISGVHFHGSPAGANGPLWFSIGSPVGTTFNHLSIGVTPGMIASMLRSGIGYIDVHTTGHPGGETRGQLNAANDITDFDADGGANLAVFRPSTGTWYLQNFATQAFNGMSFGAAGDILTPGDFDGDSKTDRAVWRESGGLGTFYVWLSATSSLLVVPFGQAGDWPHVVEDWDGDGRADFAVWRAGTFYVLQSSDGGLRVHSWGAPGVDVPILGDYDGDNRNDPAVYRIPEGRYYVNGSSFGLITLPFGFFATDRLVPGDYDGDLKTDFAVWRGTGAGTNGVWYAQLSGGGVLAKQFGAGGVPGANDLPVPADYDGDGKNDLAVVRNVAGTFVWFVQHTFDPILSVRLFGQTNDQPAQTYLIR